MKLFYTIFFTLTFFISSIYAVDEQNEYSCGIFPSVLTSYQSINASQNDVFNTCKVSVKDYNWDDENNNDNQSVTCYTGVDNSTPECECTAIHCSDNNTCEIIPEPLNRYDHTFISTDINTTETPNGDKTLTDYKYGSYTFTKNNQIITLNPSQTYDNNPNRKVMLLGNIVNKKKWANYAV